MEMLLNVKVLHLLHDFLLWVERTGMNYTFLDVKLSNIFIMTLRNSTLEPESVNVENFRRHLRDIFSCHMFGHEIHVYLLFPNRHPRL